MSFWPFSNSYSNNNQLLKFLDSITDVLHVTTDNIVDDRLLQVEFLDEVKMLASKGGDKSSFHLAQLISSEHSLKMNGSDSVSVNLNSESGTVSLSRSARESKLLELLVQPHILDGFLDYIVLSVLFFHELAVHEQEKLQELLDGEEVQQAPHEEDLEDGSESKEDRLRRCIQCSADILSTNLWVILNLVIETPALMGKLWLILSLPELLESSPSTTYFVQILDHLMDFNSIELLNFIRRQDDLVDTFLAKIEIPLLMDFFLKIIQTDKPDSPTGILGILSKQGLIPKLVEIIKPMELDLYDQEMLFRQTASTEFIKALVTISANSSLAVDIDSNIGPNQLTRELALPKIISVMIKDIMLHRIRGPDGKTYSYKFGVSNCVSILIELIRKNNSDYDLNCGSYSQDQSDMGNAEGLGEVNVQSMFFWLRDFEQNPPSSRDPVFLGHLLTLFSDHMGDLLDLMESAPQKPTTLESESQIFGITKFKISELVAELLHCSNMILLNSRKILKVVHVRDEFRLRQTDHLMAAITEPLTDLTQDDHLSDVTNGLDNVSLQESEDESPTGALRKELLQIEEYEDSDDDEPAVSAENPFVGAERDAAFRVDPRIGDYFKIKLIDLGMLFKIVSMLTAYPWHNFFHNVVFDLIQQIFNGKLNSYNSFLIVELFKSERCNISEVVSKAFQDEATPRAGYMGHLILVSEEVVKFTSLYKPALISPIIVEAVGSLDWELFVNDVLLKTRELYNVILGSDPDYDKQEDSEAESDGRNHKDSYGFDSATVGTMDLEPYEKKSAIILGDSSNHDEFVKARHRRRHGDDEDEEDEDFSVGDDISGLPVGNMSPRELTLKGHANMIYEDVEGGGSFQDDNFLDNLLGSSSSEDDDDDDDHRLLRVSKHHD